MVDISPRVTVAELCGSTGDQTIRDYVAAVLELGDFDLGRSGEGAYEAFGQMLVRQGLAGVREEVWHVPQIQPTGMCSSIV